MPLGYSDVGWSPVDPATSPQVYRRAVLAHGDAPDGYEQFNVRLEDAYDEILVVNLLDRTESPISFMRMIYVAARHGCVVRISGAYWSHVDAVADPTRRRGLCERFFGYFGATGREHLRRDPYEDGAGIDACKHLDFEVEEVAHESEPEYEARSHEAQMDALKHDLNVARRVIFTLRVHKPCRDAEVKE